MSPPIQYTCGDDVTFFGSENEWFRGTGPWAFAPPLKMLIKFLSTNKSNFTIDNNSTIDDLYYKLDKLLKNENYSSANK